MFMRREGVSTRSTRGRTLGTAMVIPPHHDGENEFIFELKIDGSRHWHEIEWRPPMRSLARIALAGFFVLPFTTFVLAQRQTENYSGRTAAAREVLASFRPISQQVLTQLIQAHDLDLMRPVGKAGAFRLRSRRMDVDALIRALSTHPNVLFVEPNYVIRAIGVKI